MNVTLQSVTRFETQLLSKNDEEWRSKIASLNCFVPCIQLFRSLHFFHTCHHLNYHFSPPPASLNTPWESGNRILDFFLQIYKTPSNLTELERIWREKWRKILKSRCAKLVASEPWRLSAVIVAKGASAKYWVVGLNTCVTVTFQFFLFLINLQKINLKFCLCFYEYMFP